MPACESKLVPESVHALRPPVYRHVYRNAHNAGGGAAAPVWNVPQRSHVQRRPPHHDYPWPLAMPTRVSTIPAVGDADVRAFPKKKPSWPGPTAPSAAAHARQNRSSQRGHLKKNRSLISSVSSEKNSKNKLRIVECQGPAEVLKFYNFISGDGVVNSQCHLLRFPWTDSRGGI